MNNNLSNKEKRAACVSLFQIKNVKTGVGRDGYTISCSVYLQGTRVALFNDYGDGCPVHVEYLSKSFQNQVENILDEYNYSDLINSVSDFGPYEYDYDEQLNNIICVLQDAKSAEQERKKIMKKTANAIIIGTDHHYSEFKYKGYSLAQIKQAKNGQELLQKLYDRAHSALEKDEYLYNTDDQLKELGIKLK